VINPIVIFMNITWESYMIILINIVKSIPTPMITKIVLILVLILSYGISKLPIARVEKYSHAFAGLAIFLCGEAIKFLGL
jgi:hypothetical protein